MCVYISWQNFVLLCGRIVEGCANGFPDLKLIAARTSETTSGAKYISGLVLLNLFTCNGTLTGLVLGVDVRTGTAMRNRYPEVSLWRSNDSVGESDEFDDYEIVPGSERTVRITPANFSTSGVFEYHLDRSLEFQAYDVLAWKQPEPKQSVVRLFDTQRERSSRSSKKTKRSNPVPLLYPITGEVYL